MNYDGNNLSRAAIHDGLRGYIASLRSPGTVAGIHVLLIAMLGVVCYSNSFSVPFIFDDYDSIVDNQNVFGSEKLWQFLLHGSRRVADFSFAVNYKLHGLQVVGYHITNLIIHISTAVVLYFLCVALLEALDLSCFADVAETKTADRNSFHFIPLAASLLFVCHPLQTQAVTYIVQRYTSLATLFYLLALLAYVKGRTVFQLRGLTSAVVGWGLFHVVMALLGFYTKPIIYSLPLMIFMLEFCLFNGRIFERILMVFCLTAILLVSSMMLPALLNGSITEVIFDLHHATSEDLYSTRMSYFLTQLRVIVTYLRLLIMPVRQRLDYDYPEYFSLLNSEVSASLALHVVMAALAVVLYLRTRHQLATDSWHGQSLRLVVIGIAWFYIALSVESSFIPITDVIMEHRVYLPSAGFFIAIAAIFQLLAQKLNDRLRYQWFGLAALCLLLSLMTIERNQVWSDDLRFWRNEASLSPRSGRVLANLGFVYLNRDNYEQALRLFIDAIKLEPNLVDAWIMLDNALQGLDRYQGRFAPSEKYLTPERDVDYRWYNEFYSNEFNNMGLANEFIGQPEDALKWYKRSLAINPKLDLAWFNMGLLSARFGIIEQANLAVFKLKNYNSGLANELENNIKSDNRLR